MTPLVPAKTTTGVQTDAAQAFSAYAIAYDREQVRNPIARWTRRRNLALLERAFAPGSHVLEIGCGTGVEAIHLARRGVQVVATDAAPGMIAVLRSKLEPGGEAHDVARRIEPLVMPASEVGTFIRSASTGLFDGAYSSFGPLNCEPDLQRVLSDVAAAVRPGGRVVISLITRFCLWETAWYLLHGDADAAFRRWGGRARATVRDRWRELRVPVYYWSTRQVRAVARRHFVLERQMALPWLLPPQYLGGLARRFPRVSQVIARIERRLASRWPFYAIGDHYVVVLVRR